MNLVQLKDSLLLFVSQWAGTTAPRLAAAFVGLLLIVLLAQALWERRLRLVPSLMGILAGAVLLAMALDTRVLHTLARLSPEARLRWLVGLLSMMVLGTALEATRRMRLQERYALLWVGTGLVTLLGALFPKSMAVVSVIFGTDYTTSLLAVFFFSVVLVLFHFSLALSRSDLRESRLAQRCALLEQRLERLERGLTGPAGGPAAAREAAPHPRAAAAEPGETEAGRRARALSGTRLAALGVIAASLAGVLGTGLRASEPILGDEVTHFYMLRAQSRDLAKPNFHAEIPVGWSPKPEVRRYPHVFGWHYLGALVHRASGGSFRAVQLWHGLFWLQLLGVAYLLARWRGGDETRASVLYLLLLASVPAAVMFAIVLYQDVPVTAQVLTAFYLLMRGRRAWAMVFLMLALAIKETAFPFVPVFVALWGWTAWNSRASAGAPPRRAWRSALAAVGLAVLMLGSYSLAWAWVLDRHAQSDFYPMAALQKTWRKMQAPRQREPERSSAAAPAAPAGAAAAQGKPAKPPKPPVIANHPGDLRLAKNYVLFGGVLIWLVAVVGLAARANPNIGPRPGAGHSTAWLWAVGLAFVIPTAIVLRSAPDARFFLPAVPFLLLPLAEWAVRVRRVKLLLALVTALALLQVGAVQSKVANLRDVTPELRETIAFLRANPPSPRVIFMYPEGNYRLFPNPHEWYLDYRLREFWRGDNDLRIAMLQEEGVGDVVIKKYLVADVDARITDLGVYPTAFVRDLERDQRFVRLFDNRRFTVYRVPRAGAAAP